MPCAKAVLLITFIWRGLLIFLHLLRILWSNILLKYSCGKNAIHGFLMCVYSLWLFLCRFRRVTCGFPTYPQPCCFGQWVVVQLMFCSTSLRHNFFNILASACLSCKLFQMPVSVGFFRNYFEKCILITFPFLSDTLV